MFLSHSHRTCAGPLPVASRWHGWLAFGQVIKLNCVRLCYIETLIQESRISRASSLNRLTHFHDENIRSEVSHLPARRKRPSTVYGPLPAWELVIVRGLWGSQSFSVAMVQALSSTPLSLHPSLSPSLRGISVLDRKRYVTRRRRRRRTVSGGAFEHTLRPRVMPMDGRCC